MSEQMDGTCDLCGHPWCFHYALVVTERHPFGQPHPRQPCSHPHPQYTDSIVSPDGKRRWRKCLCEAPRDPVYVPGRTLNLTGKALRARA